MKPPYPLTVLLFLWLFAPLAAQQPQLALRQYGTDNGLPSSEAYEILQDKRGYIWISTDNGVSRFNGYEFRNYGLADGLTDLVVLVLREDDRGRIWMGALSGQVFYYEPAQDKILAFWGNKVIRELAGIARQCQNITVDSSDVIHVALEDYGILRFMPDSTVHTFRPPKVSAVIFETPAKTISANINYPPLSPEYTSHFHDWQPKGRIPLFWYDRTGEPEEIDLPGSASYILVFPLNAEGKLVQTHGYLHYIEKAGLCWTIPHVVKDHFNSFYQDDEQGTLYFGMDNGKGVRQYADIEAIRQNRYQTLLAGYSVSHILRDREGGYWFATLQAGVFYCPNPDLALYNENSGLANGRVTSIAPLNDHEWYLSLHSGQVYYLNARTATLRDLNLNYEKCYTLLYDETHDRLWAGPFPLVYRESEQWSELVCAVPGSGIFHALAPSCLWKDNPEDVLWGAGNAGFFKVKADAAVEFHSRYIGIKVERTLAIIKNRDGRVWIGKLNGLYEFRESERQLYPPKSTHPALKLRVDALAALPDTTLVIGTKGGGILLHKGQDVRQLTRADGLTSDIIENLHVDAKGVIWAGTLSGLNKIVLKGDCIVIEQFTMAHGLPSNEIWKVATLNGKVWVATMGGLVVFRDNYRRNPVSPVPVVETFSVNDQVLANRGPVRLRHFENNLRVEYTSLQFRDAGNIQYRYRLHSDAAWAYTPERKLNFAALRPDSYLFEVQARNEDGVWSASAGLPVEIRPAWWQTGWFFAGLSLLALGIGYFIYKSRIALLHQQAALTIERNRLKDLEELEAAKSQVYENISHEFRTPLTSILGIAELIAGNPSYDLANRLAKVKVNGRRLLRLVNQMLDLSRLQSGYLQWNAVQTDIVVFLSQLTEHFQVLAGGKGIELRFHCDLDELTIDFDPEKMQQIMSNLLSNAIKFTPEQGEVQVKLVALPDLQQVVIEVRDNGIGIPPDQLPHVFDRFYQADAPTAQPEEGTGIGLAIVKELVDLMRGKIEVNSKLGEGTTFGLALPITQNAPVRQPYLPEEPELFSAEGTSPEAGASFWPELSAPDIPTILLVEDNPDVIYYLQSLFANNYRIIAARNGKEGIAKAIRFIPDLILSDIMMPEVDGFTLCKTLKEDIRTSHIPIVLITAKATQQDKQKGLEVGADDYLYKPFQEKELHARMVNLLANRRRLIEHLKSNEPLPGYWRDKARQESDFLKQLQTTIEDNLSEKIDVAALCKALGMSRTQLYRKVQALTGQSVGDLISGIRLRRAKFLLQNTGMSITNISAEIGLEDVSYFSRIFQKEYGIKPSEIRG